MSGERIQSIDHMRGFAIFGMILVNVLGHFTAFPESLRHHQYGFSFSEFVAPLFVFVSGMGLRLSIRTKTEMYGLRDAQKLVGRRFFLLVLLGAFFYACDTYLLYADDLQTFYRRYFFAELWGPLVSIGYAGLLVVLWAHKNIWFRISIALFFLIIFQVISDLTPYGEWLYANKGEGGGPLGGLSWAFPFILGTVAADYIQWEESKKTGVALFCSALMLISFGTVLSWWWPVSKPLTSISFSVIATAWSYVCLLCFYYIVDRHNGVILHITLLGKNALLVYIFQGILIALVLNVLHIPHTASPYYAIILCICVYVLSYRFACLCNHYRWRIL